LGHFGVDQRPLLSFSANTGLPLPGFGPLVFAIALEWAVGVVLFFTGLPQAMQPVHLVLSIGILASISYPLFLAARKS
jgi:hypothetical protein